MSILDEPAEIRIRGTEMQLNQLLDRLKSEFGSRIKEVSRPYKDRDKDTYRIYIKLNY